MHRIELRYCTPVFSDGLAGSAAVNQPVTAPAAADDNMTIDTVVLNTAVTTKVPVGARFTIAGETDADAVHVVLTRTPADDGPTTAITFTPALGLGTYTKTAVLTFQPQQLEIGIGDGDVKYAENTQYKYDLNRGMLDTFLTGDDVPLDVSLNFTWTYTKSGTSETISPIEAIKGIGAASEWVSTSDDPCEPYCVDLTIQYQPPCQEIKWETYVFPMFRAEKRDHDFKNANVAVTGKCNVTEPVVTRGA